jgi:hypothetical protein
MQFLTDIWLYFLADANNRTCSWVTDAKGTGQVVKNNIPTPLPQKPKGWKDVELKYGTNSKYFFMQRQFSTPLTFVNDGANILRWYAYNGKGTEEELYLIIMKWDRTSGIYILEYRGRIDFSKMSDDPYRGVTVNTLEGGVLQYINANDSVVYNIPCDARNAADQQVIYDGINLTANLNYKAPQITYQNGLSILALTFNNAVGDYVGIVKGEPSYEQITAGVLDKNGIINQLKLSGNYLVQLQQQGLQIELILNLIFKRGHIDSYGNFISEPGSGAAPFIQVVNQDLNNINDVNPNSIAGVPLPKITGSISVAFNVSDKIFIILETNGNLVMDDSSTISIILKTKQAPSTAYFLRPLDLWKALMQKMSNGTCTVESNFFSTNNKLCVTCGDALRNIDPSVSGIDGYNIKTSFAESIAAYNSEYCIGFKIIGNVLWVEPRTEIFNEDAEIFDLGEVKDFTLEPAIDMICNSIKAGYKDESYQGLTQNDGKLEINASQEWTMPITTVKKPYEIVSPYVGGCFIQEFIRQSLSSSGASYNEADNKVFFVLISDEQEMLNTPVNTYINIDINLSASIPSILTPNENDYINNNKPTVTGYGNPLTNVGIIVDGIQDGYTTTDANGFYSYNIQTALTSYAVNSLGVVITNGKHTIAAAFAPSGGTLTGAEPTTQIDVLIDTTTQTNLSITYPANNQTLWNNKPLIKGFAQAGTIVSVYKDNVLQGTATADGSGRWQFQIINAIADNNHIISAVSSTQTIAINVTIIVTSLSEPLITVPDSGFTFYINQPTFKGCAQPNTDVYLYLDYAYDYNANAMPFAKTTADNNGNWTITPTEWIPLTTTGFVIPEINAGSHIISTTNPNAQVQIGVMGYKLFRDTYTSISGVNDNSVFNIKGMTPKQMILAHGPMIAPIIQQIGGSITNATASKNKNLKLTFPNGTTYSESSDIQLAELGNPLCLYHYAKFTTKVPYTFSQIMNALTPGYVQFTVKGFTVKCLTIGEMSAKSASEETQSWKLLLAPSNDLSVFMLIGNSFLFIQSYNNTMLSISNLNPLQFININDSPAAGYHYQDINQAPFAKRLLNYLHHGNYAQPWQQSDTIQLQFVTAKLDALTIIMYDENMNPVATYNMEIVNTLFINSPYSLQQVSIPLTDLPEGLYAFVVFSGSKPLAYTEWINVQEDCPDTLLFNYSSTYNKLNPLGVFDNWQPMIRVEAMLMRAKPDSDFTNYEDENKDEELIHAVPGSTQELIIGYKTLVPDWMGLKMNDILLLNNVLIDGIHFVRDSQSKFDEGDANGSAMTYYKTTVRKAINNSSLVIDTDIPATPTTAAATLDGEVFGQAGNVINIEIQNQ